MRRIFCLNIIIGCCFLAFARNTSDSFIQAVLPDSILVTEQQMHVQGIALDTIHRCMYFSFTNRLVKTDYKGNIIGSVDNIKGHLGAIAFNPEDGLVYASLECKDDEIGRNIACKMHYRINPEEQSVFYIALFDGKNISKVGEKPEDSAIMRTVCIKEAVWDFRAFVGEGNKKVLHRYGCSGIDGVMFAPVIGQKAMTEHRMLYIGYGIYGDTTRTDNDYQVLLCYDPIELKNEARQIKWDTPHYSGPDKPLYKYFLKTGNTTYGIQNMAYDDKSGKVFIAVYKGKKAEYPNFPLFTFDINQQPILNTLNETHSQEKVLTISLSRAGEYQQGIYGWRFPWGSTGLCAIGNGCFYISRNWKSTDGTQNCNARLYRFVNDPSVVFRPVK